MDNTNIPKKIKLLINNGANTKLKNVNDETPLDMAKDMVLSNNIIQLLKPNSSLNTNSKSNTKNWK
jgi:ankyrin repeat protein